MTDDWRARLRDKLEDFVDTFVVAGAKQDDVFDAIIEEVGNLKVAVDRDLDPTATTLRWLRNQRTTGRRPTRASFFRDDLPSVL